MSGKWQGFTDEDLKLMCEKEISTPSQHHDQRNFKQKSVERHWSTSKSCLQESPKMDDSAVSALEENSSGKENLETKVMEVISSKSEIPEDSPNISSVCLKIKNDVAYEVLGNEMKSSNGHLSEFHFRQKMMEEQNRKRKELLAQALAERKRKTHAEAHRLHKIQEELQKLDNLLSNDVSILRNQIEAASLDFTEAQKRYDKAEKEFLEAKIVLFSKMEKKEMLTGHLCTIIEQNELRKARKLSELMEKLQISASNPELNDYQGNMNPSQLGTLDGMISAATATIKEPRYLLAKSKSKESQSPECTNGNVDGVEFSRNEQK